MDIQFINPEEVNTYLSRGATFIDLRDREDYEAKHIKNAIWIPYDAFEDRFRKLPKGRTYVLYCERGSSSMLAARKMAREGYRVKSLSGGFAALSQMKKD